MRNQQKWVLGMVLAVAAIGGAAGCAEEALVRFAELRDGDYVGGEETTEIETDFKLRVVGAELYLDGQRVARAPLAPFSLVWDARPFEEKEHRLTLRVHLDDGGVAEETIRVTVDNTPPVIHDLSPEQVAETRVKLPVEDNLALDRVELESDLAPGELAIGKGEPPSVTWPAGCGPSRVTLVAFDRAGNSTERTFAVTATDGRDVDCDGHRSAAAGGDDCDDNRSWIFPGAPEIAEGFDFSCDGQVARRDGVDFDGDGVLSVSDGGDDCDDADPLVHGGLRRHQSLPLSREGVGQISWTEGDAVITNVGVILNRDGVIERITAQESRVSIIVTLATGANPSSLAADDQTVVFGRGNDVVLVNAITGAELGSFTTSGPVGRLSHYLFSDGVADLRVVTFQSGTKIWLATGPMQGPGAWTQRLITDAGEPLRARPVGMVEGGGVLTVALRTDSKIWEVTLDKDGRTSEAVVGAPILTVSAARVLSHQAFVGVRGENGTGVLQTWYGAAKARHELTFPKMIRSILLVGQGPDLWVQLEDRKTFLVRQEPALRVAQEFTPSPFGVWILEASYQALAVNGALYVESGSIPPSYRADDRENHRDSDCDGYR